MSRMHRKVYVLICGFGLFACSAAFAQTPVEAISRDQQRAWLDTGTAEDRAAKRLVYDFWRKALIAHDMDAAREYMPENYIQHSPNYVNGRQPFLDFFGQLKKVDVPDYIPGLVAITADNNHVVLAFRREIDLPYVPGGTYTTTGFDMFRVANGKVVEHWSTSLATPRDPSGRHPRLPNSPQ